jgi:hypothetical protein
LTATSYSRETGSASHRRSPVSRRKPQRISASAAVLLIGCCELAGMAAIVWSYAIARTTLTSTSEFGWFWVGMSLVELPIAGLAAARATSRATRGALLLLYGIVSYAPKLLRDPTSPLYHDEYAHWRATYEILSTGKLFQPNPMVPITARYPGLHAATAALIHATGLSIWQASTLLLIVFHVSLLIGMAALAQSLGMDNRTAALVAILYGLNSSFLYFDTQYAYESMAITLVVWTLVAFVQAIRSQSRGGRMAWSVLTVTLSGGTVITHHLSTCVLVLIMVLASLTVSLPFLVRYGEPARPSAVTAWTVTLVTVLMAGAWFYFVAPSTWSYLSPYFDKGLAELIQVSGGSGGSRQLFSASLSPWWEQYTAYLVTVFALGLVAGGLLLIRVRIKQGRLPRGRRRALLSAFSMSGLIYFPSILFIFSPTGAQGARRSWAFTWIGVSILAGLAGVWLLDWAGRDARLWKRIGLRTGLAAILVVCLVGGTAAGLDAAYRFPGPFLYGSDARSVTPELLATSAWFSKRFGIDNNVITDRYTGLIFDSFGLENVEYPSGVLPFYSLYLAKPGAPISPSYLLPNLSLSHVTYLIVDERMADELPQLGVYFTSADPASLQPQGGKPAFYGRLAKFNTYSWLIKVYQSDNYSIYRINLPITAAGEQQQSQGAPEKNLLQGKLLVNS